MKTFKHCTRFLCILALMYSLTNCQDDSVADFSSLENTEAKSFPYITTLISNAEVNGNTLLTTQMRKLQTLQRSGSFAESDDSDLYDFTVDTDVVKYIENTENGSHSYTFTISRENEQTTNLENVVFSYNTQTDDYDASLVTYNLSNTQLQEFLQHNHISTSYQLTSVPLALDFTSVMGEMDMITPCTTHFTVYHITPDTNESFLFSSTDGNIQNTCEHESDDDPCETYTVVTYEDCPDGGSSSGSGSGATGGTTGGSTTGNDSGSDGVNDGGDDSYNDIVTSPITKDEMQQITEELNETLGEGNWELLDEPADEDMPSFDNQEELEEYLQSLIANNFENESSEDEPGQDNIRRDKHRLHISDYPETDLVCEVRVRVPNENNGLDRMEVVSFSSTVQSSTSLMHWTQIDTSSPSDLENGPSIEYYESGGQQKMRIKVKGRLDFGFKYKDRVAGSSKYLEIVITYILGNVNEIDSTWSYWDYY